MCMYIRVDCVHLFSVCVLNVSACVAVYLYVGYAKYEIFAQKDLDFYFGF